MNLKYLNITENSIKTWGGSEARLHTVIIGFAAVAQCPYIHPTHDKVGYTVSQSIM